MTPREARLFGDYLERAAVAIGQGRSCPIDIESLCRDLGIQLKTDARNVSRALLEVHGQDYQLKVSRANPSLRRFYVAHEIGHALLFREYGVLPSGKSEYWQHEFLCDSFARRLLLPDVAVAALGQVDFSDAKSALHRIHELAAQYGVPSCHVVAIRLRAQFPSLGVFELSRRSARDAKRRSPTDPFEVTFSSLPDKKAIGTLISLTDPIWASLDSIHAGDRAHGELDGSLLLQSLLLRKWPETVVTDSSAFAVRTRGRIRIAVVSSFLELVAGRPI